MPAKKKDPKKEAAARIAKNMNQIYKDLHIIDELDVFTLDFRMWVKREVANLKWRHPELLK